MEPASPARLYATAAGAFLIVVGILGFFYVASFGSPGSVEHELGLLRTNGWLNVLHIAAGALGLLLAGTAPRGYALAMGALFTLLAIWGWALSGDGAILGFLPAAGGDEALHLALGLLGLAAAAGTPSGRAPRPRRRRAGANRNSESKARAQVAGKRA